MVAFVVVEFRAVTFWRVVEPERRRFAKVGPAVVLTD